MPTRRCRMMMALLLCVPAALNCDRWSGAGGSDCCRRSRAGRVGALSPFQAMCLSVQPSSSSNRLCCGHGGSMAFRLSQRQRVRRDCDRDSVLSPGRCTGALRPRTLVSQCAGNFPKTECPTVIPHWPHRCHLRSTGCWRYRDPGARGSTPNILGNSSGMGGRTTLVYMVRVVRTNGMWTLRCLAFAVSDYSPTPDQVEASCKCIRPVEGANGSTPGEPWVGDRLTGACCGQGLAGRAARHSLTRNGPPAPGPAAEAQGVRCTAY